VADVPTSPARGGFNVDEVYGELRVPILADTPFFYRLELDARFATRIIRRSQSTTFTASGLWKPIPICCSVAAMPRVFARPASANSMPVCRGSDATINDPCTSGPGGSFQTTRPSGELPPMAYRRTAAMPSRPAGNSACFRRVNCRLEPETARHSRRAACTAQAGRKAGVGAEPRSQLLQYQLKNAIDSVPASTHAVAMCVNADPVSCAAIKAHGSGTIAGISRRIAHLMRSRPTGSTARSSIVAQNPRRDDRPDRPTLPIS